MRKKKLFFSEKGMNTVNLLFLLALLIPNKGIVFIAYTAWIVYLVYCIRHASSRASQAVYKALIVFAALMIFLNVYFMVK